MMEPFLSMAALKAVECGFPLDPVHVEYGDAFTSQHTVAMRGEYWQHIWEALNASRCSCSGCQQLYEVFTQVLTAL